MAVRRVRQPGWSVWLALTLSGWLLSGTVARAGCGDHGRVVVFSVQASSFIADLNQFPSGLDTNPPPLDGPRPCTGPSCSRQPSAPLAVLMLDRPPTDLGLGSLQRILPPSLVERPVLVRRRAEYASPSVDRLNRPPRP